MVFKKTRKTTLGYNIEKIAEYATAIAQYKVFKEPPVMLFPLGVIPLPLDNVKYYEVGKSMEILEYRSLNTVFMAQQKGGNWGVRIDGRLTGPFQEIIYSFLQLIYLTGRARHYRQTDALRSNLDKTNDVTLEVAGKAKLWAKADPFLLHLDQVTSSLKNGTWSKNSLLAALSARAIPGYNPMLTFEQDTTGKMKLFQGALPQMVKKKAEDQADFMKAYNQWLNYYNTGDGDDYGIILDRNPNSPTSKTWIVVQVNSPEWKKAEQASADYASRTAKGLYRDPDDLFHYNIDKLDPNLTDHILLHDIPDSARWNVKTGGSGMERYYAVDYRKFEDMAYQGTSVDETEFDIVRKVSQDPLSEITAPDDYSWNDAVWHITFTVMTAYDVLFDMYIETFSASRSVEDGIDGIEYSLLLRKHVPDRKLKESRIAAYGKRKKGGLNNGLTSRDRVGAVRINTYEEAVTENSMGLTDVGITIVHTMINAFSYLSTYELHKYGTSYFNSYILPRRLNSNKRSLTLGRI